MEWHNEEDEKIIRGVELSFIELPERIKPQVFNKLKNMKNSTLLEKENFIENEHWDYLNNKYKI